MKAYRIELMVLDFEDMDEEEIRSYIENVRYLNPSILKIDSVVIENWNDDHPLNKTDTFLEEFQKIFQKK